MTHDYAIFIGRFQPFHNGHLKVVEEGLKIAKKMIIFIGSPYRARTIKDPWTYEERKIQITTALLNLDENISDRVRIVPIRDVMYNNDQWIEQLEHQVDLGAEVNSSIVLIGHDKDESSWYLKHFPKWKTHEVENFDNINATDIREWLLHSADCHNWRGNIPAVSEAIIKDNAEKEWFKVLAREYEMVQEYKRSWEKALYPPTLVTVDSIVEHNGQVLLVTRGKGLGEGKLALPGGFINENELLITAALRELKEETSIDVSDDQLLLHLDSSGVYDHPYRSVLGRNISHAYHFMLNSSELCDRESIKVIAADDAAEVTWYPINQIKSAFEPLMFDDHYYILKKLFNW